MVDYTDLTLDELVSSMHTGCTMDEFYAVLQLLFDAVVDQNNPVQVFDMLLEKAVELEHDRFKDGKTIKKIKFDLDVPEPIMKKKAKSRPYNADSRNYKDIFNLISNGGYSFDSIVGIASGAIEMAAVAAAALETKPIILRYGRVSTDYRPIDKDVKCPYDLENQIRGKKILILDDWIATGETIKKVLDFIGKYDPASVSIIAFVCWSNINGYYDAVHRYLPTVLHELKQTGVSFKQYTRANLPAPLSLLGGTPKRKGDIYYVDTGIDLMAMKLNGSDAKLWLPEYPDDVIRLSGTDPAIESQTDTQIKRFLDNGWKTLTPAEYILAYATSRLNGL